MILSNKKSNFFVSKACYKSRYKFQMFSYPGLGNFQLDYIDQVEEQSIPETLIVFKSPYFKFNP